jgi:hypothetical protein
MEWIEAVPDWFKAHETLLWCLFAASVALFLLTPIVVAWFVIRMPPDYFAANRPRTSTWWQRHQVLGPAILVIKNVLGAVLLMAGLVMLVVPGQGALTIAVGLMMLDFPGKGRLEYWLATRRPIWRTMNWLRRKAGREPLVRPASAS